MEEHKHKTNNKEYRRSVPNIMMLLYETKFGMFILQIISCLDYYKIFYSVAHQNKLTRKSSLHQDKSCQDVHVDNFMEEKNVIIGLYQMLGMSRILAMCI